LKTPGPQFYGPSPSPVETEETSENKEGGLLGPKLADEGDIQMEYSYYSGYLYSQRIGTVTDSLPVRT
jgi:hypothetical protein